MCCGRVTLLIGAIDRSIFTRPWRLYRCVRRHRSHRAGFRGYLLTGLILPVAAASDSRSPVKPGPDQTRCALGLPSPAPRGLCGALRVNGAENAPFVSVNWAKKECVSSSLALSPFSSTFLYSPPPHPQAPSPPPDRGSQGSPPLLSTERKTEIGSPENLTDATDQWARRLPCDVGQREVTW